MARKKTNPHVGSEFEDFLVEEGGCRNPTYSRSSECWRGSSSALWIYLRTPRLQVSSCPVSLAGIIRDD
jgi:hypothetical protein